MILLMVNDRNRTKWFSIVICALTTCYITIRTAIGSILPIYAASPPILASPIEVSLVTALQSLSAVTFFIPFGFLSDKKDVKSFLVFLK